MLHPDDEGLPMRPTRTLTAKARGSGGSRIKPPLESHPTATFGMPIPFIRDRPSRIQKATGKSAARGHTLPPIPLRSRSMKTTWFFKKGTTHALCFY